MPTQLSPESIVGNRAAFNEDLIYLIRQSCAVQLARVDAFLDGIVLAAEQVQDMRLKFLETPPEVPAWKIIGQAALTFILESTIAGAILTAATKAIFTPILRQHAVFMALPKSLDGKALAESAKLLERIRGRQVSAAFQRAMVVRGLEELGRENVKLYHDFLEAIVHGSDAVGTNLTAVAKAAREVVSGPSATPPPFLGVEDSAGVGILAAAQHYASITRLGIQVRHARFEREVRQNICTADELEIIAELVSWDDLKLDVGGGRQISCNLGDIRTRYRIMFEAVIWTRVFGFDKSRNYPQTEPAEALGSKRKFVGIDVAFSDYWCKRFADSIDSWNAKQSERYRFRGKFDKLFQQEQITVLQNYFWDIASNLPTPSQS